MNKSRKRGGGQVPAHYNCMVCGRYSQILFTRGWHKKWVDPDYGQFCSLNCVDIQLARDFEEKHGHEASELF